MKAVLQDPQVRTIHGLYHHPRPLSAGCYNLFIMKTVAVIGTGIMGSGIASNFLKKGYKVLAWNRTADKLKPLVGQGAEAFSSPKEAASSADIVFEVTANDESSKEVWMGENGILAGAKSGTIVISSGTFSAKWVDELAKLCAEKNLNYFDMPMTGGRIGAESGKLVLLVGGEEVKLKEIESDLQAISEKILYFGKAGSGIRYKLLLNMLQAIHIVGLAEALKVAEGAGMDVKKVGDALAERPGGITTNLAWSGYQKAPDPINFSVQWIEKDLRYARELSDSLDLPLLSDALAQYKEAIDKGHDQADWTAVMKI